MGLLTPTSLAIRLAPGEVAEYVFRQDAAPADAGLVSRVEGGAGAFRVTALRAFREIRIPYSEEELREFPAAMRERLRREGKRELVDDGEVGPETPLAIEAGGSIEVTVEAVASGGKGQSAIGSLILEGAPGRKVQVPLALIVGSGVNALHLDPNPLRILVPPRGKVTRSVVISGGGAASAVTLALDAPNGFVSIAGISVVRDERVPMTEEEINELPPALREEARENGHLVSKVVATPRPGTVFPVPADGRVQAAIEVTAHPQAFDTPGELLVVADRWAPARVSIRPAVQAVDVTLSTARVVVSQGGPAVELVVGLAVFGAGPISVGIQLGNPGDPWHLSVVEDRVPVSLGGTHLVRLQVAAPPDAPRGDHATFVGVHWRDGLGSIGLPVTISIVPGSVRVHAFSPHFTGAQNTTASVTLRVDSTAFTNVVFRPVFLPPGVTFLPPSQTSFGPGAHPLDLRVAIDRNCPAAERRRIVIDWDANDGTNRGRLELRLTVLLTLQQRTFARPVVTPDGIPLGGRAEMILGSDGRGRFMGHMRATGLLSFRYNVVAVVRSSDGGAAVVAQVGGQVFGTDSFGPRESAWNQEVVADAARDNWAAFEAGEMAVSRAFRFGGIVGSVIDFAEDLMDTLAGAGVLLPVPGGIALAAIIVVGNELRERLGVGLIGAGTIPGLVAAAGGLFLFGPGVIVPVFLAGTAIGTAVIRDRVLELEERAFLERVFGPTLPFDRIRLTNLAGLGGRAFVCQAADGQILVNLASDTAFDNPVSHVDRNHPRAGQLLVHEVVHAWQIANGTFDASFLWRGTVGKLWGHDNYDYGPPGPAFEDFDLEQQASIVDQWFGGSTDHAPPGTFPAGRRPEDPTDPYFRYISDNIRLGRL